MSEPQTYITARAYLSEFINSSASLSRSYPMHECDVNERVYEVLVSEELERDHTEELGAFIARLREIATDAPDDVEVLVKLSAGYGYDDEPADPEIELGYWRDPTPDERAKREERNRQARSHNERLESEKVERERAEFDRLRAKFGEPPNAEA